MKCPQIMVNNKWMECEVTGHSNTHLYILRADGCHAKVTIAAFRNFYANPEKENEDVMRMPK